MWVSVWHKPKTCSHRLCVLLSASLEPASNCDLMTDMWFYAKAENYNISITQNTNVRLLFYIKERERIHSTF